MAKPRRSYQQGMRIQLPDVINITFSNTLGSLHSYRQFLEDASKEKKSQFEEFYDSFINQIPLAPPKSEDKVVEWLLTILKAAGWKPLDRRATFINKTDLKPDIWLDDETGYVEALKLSTDLNGKDWTEHCRRTVKYARHSKSQVSICTDGRRWFIASTNGGDLKHFLIDVKRFDPNSTEARSLGVLIWRHSPLFTASGRSKLSEATEVTKGIFKKHILKVAANLDDDYKEYFGLIAACAYSHYNGGKLFNTSPITEITYAIAREHEDAATVLLRDFVDKLSKQDIPGISNIAKRILSLIGKSKESDIRICRSLLLDQADRPLSWETFNSDDLSEVYESILMNRRRERGAYTTPRDLCYEIVKTQFATIKEKSIKNLALIDPCCGSGSFLDQAIESLRKDLLPPEDFVPNKCQLKTLNIYGQDIEELAVAIAIVNVYIACIRNLWHLHGVNLNILITTGDTTDSQSKLYQNVRKQSPEYSIIFGNPPFVKSHGTRLGAVTNRDNLLFKVTEKVIGLCNPGEIAFVLPAHVKGSDAAQRFDKVVSVNDLRLRELWHLPELKLFRGCGEKRHIVAFWKPDTREKAKLLVLTPPKSQKNIGISQLIQQSKSSPSLHFSSSETNLFKAPLFANQYIPTIVKKALESLPRLKDAKQAKLLTIVNGIQESHPFVPTGETSYTELIKKEGYTQAAPIFVIPPDHISKLSKTARRAGLTDLEKKHLRLHAKATPSTVTFQYPRSKNKVIFSDRNLGKLTETQFEQQCPNFCAWLKPYYALLMTDIDRREQRRKWWQLHRSCDPNPNKEKIPGINFNDNKVILNQFLSTDFWAWADRLKHVVAGRPLNTIACFPDGVSEKKLRPHWPEIATAWLNSYLVRQVWLKLLGHCKLRGADGEVQVGQLLEIPFPQELIVSSANSDIENVVKKIEAIATKSSDKITNDDLVDLDMHVWRLFELAAHESVGEPMTRSLGEVELKPSA